MSIEFNVDELGSILADCAEGTAPIAYPNTILLHIVADVVGVAPIRDGLYQLERAAIKNAQRAVRSVCDVNPVCIGCVFDPLRFMKTGYCVYLLRILDIYYFERIVAERGDKQALALDIDRHVVDAPLDVGHLNRCDQM